MSFSVTKVGTKIRRAACAVSLALAAATVLMLAAFLPGVHASDSGKDAKSSDKTGAPVAVEARNNGPSTLSSGAASQESSPIFVTEMPRGYRDWKLISVSHEEGNLTDIRAILGNDIAIKAYRDGTLPLPEGAIIARLAWRYDESEENNKAFAPFLKQGMQRSFVAGPPTNGVQFMIKESKKYAATGGWGYGHFHEGKPADKAFMRGCYPCHQAIKSRDFVFARYAP
jgi:hypothetical protein